MNIHEMIDCLTKQIALRQDAIRALQAIDGPQFDWQPDNTPAPVGTKPKPNIKKASARRRQALREKFGNGAAHAGASTAGSFTHELLQVVRNVAFSPFTKDDIAPLCPQRSRDMVNWTLRHLVKKGDLKLVEKGGPGHPSKYALPGAGPGLRRAAAGGRLPGPVAPAPAGGRISIPGLDAPPRDRAQVEADIREALKTRTAPPAATAWPRFTRTKCSSCRRSWTRCRSKYEAQTQTGTRA